MNEFQQDSCCAVPIFNHALKREKKNRKQCGTKRRKNRQIIIGELSQAGLSRVIQNRTALIEVQNANSVVFGNLLRTKCLMIGSYFILRPVRCFCFFQFFFKSENRLHLILICVKK